MVCCSLVLLPVYSLVVVTYIEGMYHNSKRAVSAYLSECTVLGEGILPEEVIYEVGGPKKQGFLSGLLETIDLPDVTIKPHRDMTYLIGGTALILSLGAIGTAYILKQK